MARVLLLVGSELPEVPSRPPAFAQFPLAAIWNLLFGNCWRRQEAKNWNNWGEFIQSVRARYADFGGMPAVDPPARARDELGLTPGRKLQTTELRWPFLGTPLTKSEKARRVGHAGLSRTNELPEQHPGDIRSAP